MPSPPAGDVHLRAQKWWAQFADVLQVSASTRRELERSSREIIGLLPDPQEWQGARRPIRGLVVGSIQSGKTGHMMALAARALDQGFRIIVVLAGARDDLRTQTARRFNTQLLRKSETIEGTQLRTLPGESAAGAIAAFSVPYHLDCHRYALLLPRLKSALSRGEPAVIVLKKNIASLSDLAARLRIIYAQFELDQLPLLVIDDECDEASIEEGDRTIPEAIGNLWRTSSGTPPAAYVGFTATAAANVLQSSENDLYPDQFAYLLRFPAQSDTALSFAEPNADAWYTGTDAFFDWYGDTSLDANSWLVYEGIDKAEVLAPPAASESLTDALRAYFVAGAFRLAVSKTWSWDDASCCPKPHTMLVQASAAMLEHGRWAEAIAQRFGDVAHTPGAFKISWAKIRADLEHAETKWREWFDEFTEGRERLYRERPHPGTQVATNWTEVRDLIREVAEHTTVKVVNSDPEATQTLDFASRSRADGTRTVPQDIFVIVIGGSKLSRGITIEGLCISYFRRWSSVPTEDTVLQISRWFGYRGPHLEFCRLITTGGIAISLREIAYNDRDLRYQLASLMEQRLSPRDAAMILRSQANSLPTAKLGVGSVVNLAFSPRASVFRLLEVGACADANTQLALSVIQAVRSRSHEKVVSAGGSQRGELSREWRASEVATLLDLLEYERHNPVVDTIRPNVVYRAVDIDRPSCTLLEPTDDPYWVASYLRMWEVSDQRVPAPSFNVGFIYGEMTQDCAPFDFPLVNRFVSANNIVDGGWGGRSNSWRGDAFFDNPAPADIVAGSSYRKQGANGLLLMYVIHRLARGRRGGGAVRAQHSVTFGIVIPAGGPAERRVLVPQPKK